ncbi:LysR substrate-binding domain-containing protein [Methyloversatilis sp.]|uniref:LysR substrate-binding domain-containing protein n=1 Tax=Methyloversatilis sp. TaxID=2569862 RepID=UPI0027354E9D|nr:LysR substrate-binding domain-containing protein [Methyloversatilis sp.]MDP2868092.1 LysR substrate-binding domain-containing protein [Methyloversatilis sp.]MDP3454922.1 LysR substrate-binding domain-containing protein [Methyloversatilis sp.]MDP3577940.1 LysR substrate-binding domain-containing protein [Methyloversatilis sp.]
MDTLRAMRAFVNIAEHGSLTAAARALDSSLPAVVRTLAALEAHLGVRLINRTTRRIALTDEGRNYLESCRQVLSAVQDAEEALKEGAAEPSGPITLTAPVQFGLMHVAPVVTRFALQYPRVKLRVLLHDRVVNLLEEGIDVGVRIGALDDSGLIARPLGTIRRVVVASPALIAARGEPSHPDALRGAPCVHFTGASSLGWSFHINGRIVPVPVAGNLEFNHVAPAVAACAAGAGFGLFLCYQVRPHLEQGTLRVVLREFEPPPRPVNIIYPHARLLPGRTRLLVDWLTRELGGDSAAFAPDPA